ncbi:phage head closure protein [Rummeliibacillus stabekisii]|uniref:phage head closure protein n=1 Tax=Rummeliibacillus stabekisii TaxID=241244 RepID=UPI003714AC5A
MAYTSIGQMKSRIDFYGIKIIRDEYGDTEKVRTKVYSCWADIKTQYLKDVTATIGTMLENTINFVIRHQKDIAITNDMEIVHEGITYQIVQIQNDIQYKKFDTIIAKRKG